MQHFDVAIIGGGPAGLTAAMTLSRSLRRVLVLDAPRPPRNAFADEMHGIVGLDGVSPGEYRRRAWADLEKYGVAELHEVTGTDVTPDPEGGFTVTAEEGPSTWARQVLLATGMVDVHPEVEGFGECWGRTVIHCPFCLGWENRDRRWAVVTDDPESAVTAAAGFSAWSDDVIVLVNGTMPEGEWDGEIVAGEIRRLHHDGGDLRAVELADGTIIERETLLWRLDQRPVPLISRLAGDLGLAVDEGGHVETDSSFHTSVPGIYAAGDLITASQAVVESAAAGSGAAFQIIADAPRLRRDVLSALPR